MKIIQEEFKIQRDKLSETAKNLQRLCRNINNDELMEIVSELRNRIDEPFMFVVVGEVKAGKSSFINALLKTEEEICAVAPDPKTDCIHLIEYGENFYEERINPTLKKLFYPEEILKELAIVDTPGTNTIIDYHQEITEKFIPASDLVIFVFEAKNPYRQSAWDFFKFVQEKWHKKIIFVLQQKDLMSPEDLKINEIGLSNHAKKSGIEQPIIFSLSAKKELNEEDESGFQEIRDFILENITGGKAPFLKLKNNLDTFTRIFVQITEGIKLRERQLNIDHAFRSEIDQVIEEEERLTRKRIKIFLENLLYAFDHTTKGIEDELKSQLSFFNIFGNSFKNIFSKNKGLQPKMESLAEKMGIRLHQSMSEKTEEGVVDISDGLKQMLKIIDLKIQNSQTVLKNDHDLFSNIALKREQILLELRKSFDELIKSTEKMANKELLQEHHKIGRELIHGGGIAVIGIIVAAVTQVTIFDITGGILTTVGIIFAGVSTGIKRRKIIREFRDAVQIGRQKLSDQVEQNLYEFIANLKSRLLKVFAKFDQMLLQEEMNIGSLNHEKDQISQELQDIRNYLKLNSPKPD